MSHKCKTKACKTEILSGWYCMSCHEKRERYCPCCLDKLDNSDSCWNRSRLDCEYESHPKNPPLNRVQMLEKKIVANKKIIAVKRIVMIRLSQENVAMMQELEALSDA